MKIITIKKKMEMDDQNSFHDRIIPSRDGTMNIRFDLNWEST